MDPCVKISWSASPCHMSNLPPDWLKGLKFGSSVPTTLPYISTDGWNSCSNCRYEVVVQSQVPCGTGGFRWTHVPRYCSTSGNGTPIVFPPLLVVFASPS